MSAVCATVSGASSASISVSGPMPSKRSSVSSSAVTESSFSSNSKSSRDVSSTPSSPNSKFSSKAASSGSSISPSLAVRRFLIAKPIKPSNSAKPPARPPINAGLAITSATKPLGL